MNARPRRFTLALLICLLATSVHAQAQQPEPQRLPSPSSAPKNVRFDQPFGTTITQGTKIVQDSKGYLWIGSFWAGLTRYDGYSTQRFVNDPDDPRSLSNNQIFALLDDPDGVLWVGTIGGLNRYDPETGTFQHILHDPADAGSLSNDQVFALMKDRDGQLWIGTREGLNRYDPQTGANTRFKLDAGGPGSAATDRVESLMQDRAGTIWVGSWGLHRYDPETDTFSAFLPDPAIPEPGADPQRSVNRIQSIHEDRRGRIWVGTEGGGLYRFDPEKGTFFNYRKEAFRRNEDQDDNLRTITEDTEGGLWLGTERGLIWFDPDSGDTTSFRNNTLDSYSLSGDNINTVYLDRQGVMWASSMFSGVNRFDRAARPFEHIYPRPGDPTSLRVGSYGVQQIFDGPDGALWVSAAGFLNRVDRKSGVVEHFTSDPEDPNSLLPGVKLGLHVERSGRVWVGTASGLSRMDPDRSGYFTHFRYDPDDPTSLGPATSPRGFPVGARGLLEDSRGVLWVATDGFGLNRMEDREQGRFTRFPFGGDPGWINSMYEDSDGVLWMGTHFQGLYRFDPRTEALTRYDASPDDPTSLTTSNIIGVCERPAHPDVLWVAAYGGGLNRFDKRTGAATYLTSQNSELPDNGVQGVLCDSQGLVWVSTDAGISRFHPESGTFKNFDQDDGLQDVSFNAWAFHKSRYTGEMFFGGRNGVNAFFPGEVGDNPNPPEVLFTGLKLFNEPVPVGDGSPLARLLSETEAFTLSHNQNDVTFDFVGLHFSNPAENQYAYKLEGYDDDWRSVGTQRTATFTNLDPGAYTFRVKAANSDGVWNEEGASVRMTILPPWWRTTWAYLLYGLLFVVGVFAVDRLQRHRLLRKERERAAIAEAHLRAEAAEAEARALEADNQRKRNVELLSDIGKEITASLDIDTIFDRLYVHAGQLMDVDTFGVGLYHADRKEIEYRLAIEQGKRYTPYTRDMADTNQFPVWCITHRQPVFINDVAEEYSRYLAAYDDTRQRLEDGSLSDAPQSLLYLPLMAQERVLGVITVQSFQKNAYTEHDLNVLKTLAAYTSIALDNAAAYRQLGTTLAELKATQAQLVQQEKMASLGQLTAGIAHEIKNPLNFINNFAEVNEELAQELREALANGEDVQDLLADLEQNAAVIAQHGKRADGIVHAMMQHASGGTSQRETTDLNHLVAEHIDLAFHGKRAQVPDLQVAINRNLDEKAGAVDLVSQEIGRVLLNLLGNAFDAVHEHALGVNGQYEPTVTVSTRQLDGQVEIIVSDNGPGIPSEFREKIFEPFFTTKPTGSGTGLGLSLSYDIVTQGHGGTLTVESEEGKGATFIVMIPAIGGSS